MGYMAHKEEKRKAYRVLAGNNKERRPPGRLRRRGQKYIYAVQQDTQSVLMSEFIHHIC